MQIIQGTTEFKIKEKTVVAIGKFDGMHIGHQSLIEEMQNAKREGLTSVIFTFEPSPAAFFSGKELKELSTRREKREFFEKMGIDILVEFPLNKQTAAITPQDFISEILIGKLNIKKIVAGTDLSFGDKGEGNCQTLKQKEREYGYELVILEKLCFLEREISSTFIREEIEKGNINIANTLLGEAYTITGEIIEKLKESVLIKVDKTKLLPPQGCYRAEIIQKELLIETKVYSLQKNEQQFMEIECLQTSLMVLNKREPVNIKLLEKYGNKESDLTK